MATCKECICYESCLDFAEMIGKNIVESITDGHYQCEFFKNRSRFVELPDVGDYDTVTTIDEAIDHCYQIATSTDETVCAECKAEHLRLCSWLGDLKRRIVAEQALKEREENETTGYCRRDSKSGTMGIISHYRSL